MDNRSNEYDRGAQTAVDELRSLEKVRIILNAISKFIHGKKIYAKNNPTLAKFAKEFDAAFQAFFEQEDELVLAIERYRITWRDQVVYENDKREESLAFLLYKDGIGEITFQGGVTFEELDTLVDILKEEIHNYSPDDDIVTKFWRSDFEHISYRVMDEYLVGLFGEGRPDEQDAETPLETEDHPDLPSFADKGRVIVNSSDSLESLGQYLHTMAGGDGEARHDSEYEERFQSLLESFFTVSSEELKLCQETILEEKKNDLLVAFLQDILDFTLLQENPSAVRDVSNVIERIVDYVIEEAKPAALREALESVRRFRSGGADLEGSGGVLDRVEEKLVDTELLMSLGKQIDKWSEAAEQIFAYYLSVGRRAIPTISTMLDELKSPRLHVLACDTLVAVGREDLPQIIEKLDVDNARVAQDVVYMLRSIESEEVPEIVHQLMFYPDNKVREEIIRYLAEKNTQDATFTLLQLLDDEDQQIRIKTLSAVQDIRDPMVGIKVKAMAFDKEAGERSLEEQECIFRALGKVQGEDVLPEITNMIEKRSLFKFGKGQDKHNKLLALRALEQMRSSRAEELLRRLADDADNLVKVKAQRALRALEAERSSQDVLPDEAS